MFKKTLTLSALILAAHSYAGEAEIRDILNQYFIPNFQAIEAAGINNPKTVGPGGCDFSSIQAAVDSDADQVRIVDKGSPYFENIKITDSFVALEGNYANCNDAESGITSDVRAVIDGNDTGSVISIYKGDLEEQRIAISHLVIQNGDAQGDDDESPNGGGINAGYAQGSFVMLDNLLITDNMANVGGGINTSARLYIKDTVIDSNKPRGIDGYYYTVIDGHSKITNNDGGAINGSPIIFSPAEISGNHSEYDGGGIRSRGFEIYGGQICEQGYCFGAKNQPVSIINNSSEQRGGGISVWLGKASIHNALFQGNHAPFGGALSVGSSYSDWSREVTISNSLIMDNRASYGSVAQLWGDVDSEPSLLTIKNSVIANNGSAGDQEYNDLNLFFAIENASLNLNYNTFANNEVTDVLIHNYGADVGTSVVSSIFDQSEPFFFGPEGASLAADCLLIKNLEGITLPLPADIQVGDAEFVDAENGDYHLTADSPAIDFCGQMVEGDFDKDGNPRGFDDIKVDQFGTYDLGAYEYIGIDIIFKDGFE